jgi:hypothetical protein
VQHLDGIRRDPLLGAAPVSREGHDDRDDDDRREQDLLRLDEKIRPSKQETDRDEDEAFDLVDEQKEEERR